LWLTPNLWPKWYASCIQTVCWVHTLQLLIFEYVWSVGIPLLSESNLWGQDELSLS
jgi:hypothetical protein